MTQNDPKQPEMTQMSQLLTSHHSREVLSLTWSITPDAATEVVQLEVPGGDRAVGESWAGPLPGVIRRRGRWRWGLRPARELLPQFDKLEGRGVTYSVGDDNGGNGTSVLGLLLL